MTDLSALREAVAKMTGGVWRSVVITPAGRRADLIGPDCQWPSVPLRAARDDVEGIVALRNAAPALLDELEAARAVLDGAGVEFEDPRISYTTIQVDHAAWEAWRGRGRT